MAQHHYVIGYLQVQSITVTSWWVQWRLKSPVSRLLAQYFENIKTLRHWSWRGIHRWSLDSPHKGPVTREMFPFDGVIMTTKFLSHVWTGFKFEWSDIPLPAHIKRRLSVRLQWFQCVSKWSYCSLALKPSIYKRRNEYRVFELCERNWNQCEINWNRKSVTTTSLSHLETRKAATPTSFRTSILPMTCVDCHFCSDRNIEAIKIPWLDWRIHAIVLLTHSWLNSWLSTAGDII